MKTQGQYTLFETMDEFAQFIQKPLQRQITSVQNHHTAEPSYNDFTGTNHFERLKAMKSFHVNDRKFADIAQNLTTFPDGTIAVCRPMDKTPAGIKGANTGAICIEHLGNFDKNQDQMSAAQRACILKMNALLVRRFKLKIDTDTFVYHHWFDLKTGQRRNGLGEVKSCPGTNFFGGNKVQDAQANFLPLIRQAVAALDSPIAIPRAQVQSPDGVLTIRSGPAGDTQELGKLGNGDVVQIHEINGIWRRIDGVEQKWVSSKFLVPG